MSAIFQIMRKNSEAHKEDTELNVRALKAERLSRAEKAKQRINAYKRIEALKNDGANTLQAATIVARQLGYSSNGLRTGYNAFILKEGAL